MGPLHFHSFGNEATMRPSVWAPLLPSKTKIHSANTYNRGNNTRVQRATDPKWRPCSGILHTSSASSACCPVIKGERKRRQNITQSIFVISSYSCSFVFPPLPTLKHGQNKQPKAHVSPQSVWASCIADQHRQKESKAIPVSLLWLRWCYGHRRWTVSILYRHLF